ncbi:ImmA/IrrE family metallo-endopeptidase [Cellulosimicrobium composti]|uniref:ImmA/IrrE family metallo-endopeptidase n=1 Tax=Cellulosimicrobium composti TaxID=2672572 RepID=UPI0037891836
MQDLINYAIGRGWGLKYRDLGRRNGQYSQGLITINDRRRTHFTIRMTLAHEIGHAHHDHPWTDDPETWASYEREAAVCAAHLLITPDDYAFAERVAGVHPGAIAKELGVTQNLVELWRATYCTRDRGHLRTVG